MAHTTSRRELLKVGLGALPVISMAGTMPAFVPQMAFAQQNPAPAANMSFFVTSSNPKGGNLGGLADLNCFVNICQ